MKSEQKPTPLIVNITNHLPLAEKVALAALAAGIILTSMKIDSYVTRFAFLALGIIYFLMAYRPTNIPIKEGEQFGFKELLGLLIIPKVLWISSAMSILGIVIYLFNSANDGYKKMLLIGATTCGAATLLIVVFFIMDMKHIKSVTPILLRAIPLLVIDIYMILNNGISL